MNTRSYAETIERDKREHGTRFDESELAPKFVKYYESGERIEVDFGDGFRKRGTIGKTTGWRPCFLLMLRRDSIGSVYTLSEKDEIVKVVRRGAK